MTTMLEWHGISMMIWLMQIVAGPPVLVGGPRIETLEFRLGCGRKACRIPCLPEAHERGLNRTTLQRSFQSLSSDLVHPGQMRHLGYQTGAYTKELMTAARWKR